MQTATVSSRDDTRAEYKTLGLVSAAHLVSHLYWLAFVPILPDLKALLGVSYTDLALAITVMNVVSALTQAPTGFLCDRVGARTLLVAGLVLGGLGFAAIGIWPSYAMLLAGSVAIGLANAVYHPADYSILAAEMSQSRMGRAFSIHAFMGYLGFAVAPPVMLAAAHFGGARGALVVCGLIGPLVALPLLPDCAGERHRTRAAKKAGADQGPSAMALLTPAVILLTVMYTVLNLGTGILQTYMVVGLSDLFHFPRATADWGLTLFMCAMVTGVLAGGFLADRAARQSIVTSGGFGLAALIVVVIGTFDFGAYGTLALVSLAGFLAGLIMPSRDMLTRAASPPGAVGRVFGIVTTGFNFGGMIGPVIGAWFIDHGAPAWIFYSSAIFMAVTILLAIRADTNGKYQPAQK
jgi:FSR family fosmidomycin resistance protein-like MFS transporter